MICNHCGVDQHKREFTKNISKPGGIHPTCKECRRKQNEAYYRSTKNRFRACRKESRERIKQAGYEYVNGYKSEKGCKKCGEKDFRCLDFHHIDPKTKTYEIASIIGCSLKKVKLEVSKCEVLCANCHRKEHYGSIV